MLNFLKRWFKPHIKSERFIVAEKSNYRLIHEVYEDKLETWYTEVKTRGLDVVMFVATKVPFQKDTWTMVENSTYVNLELAKQVFDHISR